MSGGFSFGGGGAGAMGRLVVIVGARPGTPPDASRLSERPSSIEEAIKSLSRLGGMTPRGIRTHLGLNKPIYRQSAAYGHFGRAAEGDAFPWERTDLVDDLKAALSA